MTEAEALAIATAEAEQNETPEQAFQRTGTPTGKTDPLLAPNAQGQFPSVPAGTKPTDEQGNQIDPYNWTAAGMPLPKELQPIGDYIAGLNSSLADLAGIAVDDMDIIMRDLGQGGLLDMPGSGKQKVIEALEAAGIGADRAKAANQFLARLGDATGENLLMLSAFMAAGPTLLSAQGSTMMKNLSDGMGGTMNVRVPSSVGAQFQQQLGQALVKAPGTAIAAETGAGIGGQALSEVGAQAGPAGEAIGGMVGAMGGGMLGAIPGVGLLARAGRGAAQGYQDVKSMVGIAKNATEPALIPTREPDVNLISQAIQSDQNKVEGIIDRLSARMTQGADPIQTTRQMQVVQRQAYTEARNIENGYWKKVDKARKLDSIGLKQFGQNLVKATAKEGRTEWLPTDLLNKVKGLPQRVSIERMRAIRTIAFQRLQSGAVPTPQGVLPMNDTLRHNLRNMIGEIDNQIAKAYPNDIELKKATTFSTWLHDKFTRGPVAQFARPRAKSGALPGAQAAARQATGDERFGPQSADIAQTLEMPEVEKAATDFLRGQLAQEMEKLGPQAADKWLKKPAIKSFVEAYPKLASEFTTTGNRLTKALEAKKVIYNSAFIKAANEAPETAINRVITSQNKVRDSKLLYDRLKYDPEALEAAKHQTILELERIAGGDPSKILSILDSPDTRTAVNNILGSDLNKLEGLARRATELMQVKDGLPRYLTQRGGRVLGAFLARKLNTGTLQAPEIGGRLTQKLVDDWMGRTEKDIFAKAIRYPAWRAILMTKMPESVSEARQLQVMLRRAIRVEEAAERSTPLAEEEFNVE